VEEAIRDLNQVIILRPHYAAAYLNRGLARFELDDYASALRDYDQAIRFEPDNALAFNNRGIVKHKLGDYEGAIMDYDVALKLNPEMASAYFNRAMAREILGRPGFENDYRIAAHLNPQFDLESRRIETEQLAQNQTQQTPSSSVQPDSTQNNSIPDQDTPGLNDENRQEQNTGETQNDSPKKRRQRINLIIEDSRDLPAEEEEKDVEDGLIQNRNVVIDLQPIFIVSAFEKNSVDYDRFQYYNLAIDELNKQNNYNPLLTITNKTAGNDLDIFKNFILYFNARLDVEKNSHNYLNRSIFYSLTGDFNAALEDVNLSIQMDENQAIAYYIRANTRYKMQEQIELLADTPGEVTVPVGGMAAGNEFFSVNLTEYQQIIDDYQTLLHLNPKFFFGYFNLAYMKLRMKDYESAMEDLSQAIELEPEFAEAYFNRGLTKIFLDDIDGGALDLSRAGELGIHGAYNIIKRYCN